MFQAYVNNSNPALKYCFFGLAFNWAKNNSSVLYNFSKYSNTLRSGTITKSNRYPHLAHQVGGVEVLGYALF